MLLPPSTSTRTDTRFPYATPCRGYGTKLCRAAARPGPFVGRSLTHVRELALPVIWPAAPDRRGDAVCWQSLGRAGWSARPARPAAARGKPSAASLHCAPAPTPSLARWDPGLRSEEHTSELQSLLRISSAVFCLKQKQHHSNRA